ncbi:MAG: type II secretion system protein [Aquabacterium sp.]|nr:type II secretion system protein [Aquabacterium sp.]
MRPRPRGFTLIEQLAGIALVGTASATALPMLADVRTQAEDTLLASLAAAAGAAMALNQAGCLVTRQQAVPGKCQPASIAASPSPASERLPACAARAQSL